MSLIQVTPDHLNNEAARLIKYKSQQEAEIARMRGLVQSLGAQWKGEAQSAFVNKFNSMEYIYKNFSSLLEAYAQFMRKAAAQFQMTDNRLGNRIGII